MDTATLKAKLIEIINEIQTNSGLECPQLTGATKPVGSVPNFDSKVWAVATTLLSEAIGAPIPNDTNIFVDGATKAPRSIDDAAAFVCDLLQKQAQAQAAVAA